MEILPLTIRRQDDGPCVFSVNLLGETREFTTAAGLAILSQEVTPREHMEELLPPGLCHALRQWELASQKNLTLAIIEYPEPSSICWEWIPTIVGLHGAMVTRVWPDHEKLKATEPLGTGCTLLAAGWADSGAYRLTGIDQELADMVSLGEQTGIQVLALVDVSIDEFSSTYGSRRPQILHLASVAAAGSRLFLGAKANKAVTVEADELADIVQTVGPVPELIMLNCCDTDRFAATLQRSVPSIMVGWIGKVHDQAIVDFTAVFYARLLEGHTVVDAIRSFDWKILGPSVLPSIWHPDLDHIGRRLFEPRLESEVFRPASGVAEPDAIGYGRISETPVSGNEWSTPSSTQGSNTMISEVFRPSSGVAEPDVIGYGRISETLVSGNEWSTPSSTQGSNAINDAATIHDLNARIDLELVATISPALLINGEPVMKRLVIHLDKPVRGAILTLRCDGGRQVSCIRQTYDIQDRRLPVRRDCIHFPALHELIDANIGRRMINITATLEVRGEVVVHVTRSVLWMACDEWMDQPETWSYLPAFVLPHCSGVQTVLDSATEKLKTLTNPTAAFDGYQTDSEHVMKQVHAMFITLRDVLQLSYINPPGSPVYTQDNKLAKGQKVRFCNEVVEYKRGTCHDLALTFASVIEYVGIHCLVILVRGHTFFGFWVDDNAHHDFWSDPYAVMGHRSSSDKPWVIQDKDTILNLYHQQSLCLVESTYVTDRNSSFEEACEEALKRMEQFDCAIDVAQSRREVQPIA